MKKTLTALAVLGAFAGTAAAADVTLYGKIDAGLNWAQTDVDYSGAWTADKVDTKSDTFAMKSGQNSGSRFGIKGTEDLGNGMKVGFVLENGFKSDTGAFGNSDKLFDRQATLFVNGAFGEVAFGRVGALSSGLGSYSTVYNNVAFGTGWDLAATTDNFGLARTRMDNTVTYKSPEFAGLTVTAQYSFQTGLMKKGADAVTAESSNSGDNQRYAGLGLNYKLNALNVDLVVDTVKRGAEEGLVAGTEGAQRNGEDSLGVSLGASYDFGFMKVYGMGQYGKNENFGSGDLAFVGGIGQFKGAKGYTLAGGVSAPIVTGTIYAQVNYIDAEDENISNRTHEGYGLAVAYEYPLSTRTKVYSFAAYNSIEDEYVNNKLVVDRKMETEQTVFGFGMVHNF